MKYDNNLNVIIGKNIENNMLFLTHNTYDLMLFFLFHPKD